jgi:hypothetical protein
LTDVNNLRHHKFVSVAALRLFASSGIDHSHQRNTQEVETRIIQADCVLVLAGMYGSWSPWIQSEIESAQDNGKPIIGVEPHGQQRIPQEVQNAAVEMISWRSESIVAAVRRAVPIAR